MASSKEHTAVNSEDQPLSRISHWQGMLKIRFSELQVELSRVVFLGRITKKGKN